MSDVSWLNPTPHAIAVYASRPLSPVATQHSLPSGRYSLLGPDFHRLDRAACLAHSFDHLVGGCEQLVGGTVRPSMPGGRQVDDQFEFGWCMHGKVGWLFAFEICPLGCVTPKPSTVSIRTTSAMGRVEAKRIHGGQAAASRDEIIRFRWTAKSAGRHHNQTSSRLLRDRHGQFKASVGAWKGRLGDLNPNLGCHALRSAPKRRQMF